MQESQRREIARELLKLAERGGFEPPVDFKGLRRFSKPLLSTTQPPLHFGCHLNSTTCGHCHYNIFATFCTRGTTVTTLSLVANFATARRFASSLE
jgi:hypothetical protein